MTVFRLTNAAARKVFLDRHALLETPQGDAKGDALLSMIKRLGFVQLDSINTVARAHDLILFSRRPKYRQNDLKRLYERDGALFEHWTHDAAIIPIEFYRWWHLRRQRDAAVLRSRWRDWRRGEFEARFDQVLDQIRENGPLCSADVGKEEKRGSGGWWDWHPSKTALEYLWRSGKLHVVGRDNFRKRYDLSERALDQSLIAECPSDTETIDWCCREALKRLGLATHGELAAFWDHVSPAEAKQWCENAQSNGDIIQIEVQDAQGNWKPSYAFPEIEEDPALAAAPCNRLRVLSPFDPALRDRKRAEKLFGFNYRIEIFVPEAKRVYGYYVFPILQGDKLVGRVDMKAHRDRDILHVRAVWPEPKVRWGKARVAKFETEVQRLTRIAGVGEVSWSSDWLRI